MRLRKRTGHRGGVTGTNCNPISTTTMQPAKKILDLIKRLTIRRRAFSRGVELIDGKMWIPWAWTDFMNRNLIRLNRIQCGIKPFSRLPAKGLRTVGDVPEFDCVLRKYGNIAALGVILLALTMAGGCVPTVGRIGNDLAIGHTSSASIGEDLSAANKEADNIAAAAKGNATVFAHVASLKQDISAAMGHIPGVNAAIAAGEAATKGWEQSKAQVKALTNSWGYQFQVWTIRFFWWTVIAIAIHVVAGLLAIWLPKPYSTIAGIVSKIVNPMGWFTWLVSHIQTNQAVAAASNTATTTRQVIEQTTNPPSTQTTTETVEKVVPVAPAIAGIAPSI